MKRSYNAKFAVDPEIM